MSWTVKNGQFDVDESSLLLEISELQTKELPSMVLPLCGGGSACSSCTDTCHAAPVRPQR